MTSPLQKKLKIHGPTVVTANRLADGVVVWLTAAGGWSQSLAEASVVHTPEEVQHLLDVAHQDENTAVGAYMATVGVDAAGVPHPATMREKIRVAGPTIAMPGVS